MLVLCVVAGAGWQRASIPVTTWQGIAGNGWQCGRLSTAVWVAYVGVIMTVHILYVFTVIALMTPIYGRYPMLVLVLCWLVLCSGSAAGSG